MDLHRLEKINDYQWSLHRTPEMRVPGILFGSESLMQALDDRAAQQLANVASLPGIVKAAWAMPDAHWGYGFPIGGVAAFDAEEGVVSAGGVGFDISCGVRLLTTQLSRKQFEESKERIAEKLFRRIPAGVGSHGVMVLNDSELTEMLTGGAQWALQKGYGEKEDLDHIEEHGQMKGARPEEISGKARERQRDEMGTLGSGNHYLEIQEVTQIFDPPAAKVFGLKKNDVVVSIHCGSRGLGHQIGTEYLRLMALEAEKYGISRITEHKNSRRIFIDQLAALGIRGQIQKSAI